MKEYIIYECEYCGKKSKVHSKIVNCEARHLGLSHKEWEKYEKLKERAQGCKETLEKTSNYIKRWDISTRLEELSNFEKEHNIHEKSRKVI